MAWNKPNQNNQAKDSLRRGRSLRPTIAVRGAIAGAIVVLGAAVAAWWLWPSGESAGEPPKSRNAGLIKEVSAVVVTQQQAQIPAKPVRLSKKGTPIPENVQPDERGVLRYPGGLRWVDTNDLHRVQHPRKRKLFTHACDNHIANILTMDPVRMPVFMVGKRIKFGDRFVEDFKASLSNPEIIDKNDTPEEAEVRKAVNETKAELKARMDAGEDIAKIMNDAQAELDRLCLYRNELKKEIDRVNRDETISDADVEDYVRAANMMLEKQGIKTFAMPKLMKRQARLQLLRERRAKKPTDK